MANNAEQDKWKARELGALWKKESSGGQYLTGKIKVGTEEVRVVVFTNKHKKEGDQSPDFRIYISEERQQGGNATTAKAAPKQTPKKSAPVPTPSVDDCL